MAHVSTGNIVREEIQRGTPLGRQVEGILRSGKLVSDDVVNAVVKSHISTLFPNQTEFLFDGYPRTVPQARELDGLVTALLVLELAVPEQEVLRRLASRMVCSECGANAQDDTDHARCHDCGGPLVPRADDKEAVVRERMSVYRTQTEPLVQYYGSRFTFRRVNGDQMADEVTNDLVRAVEELCGA
jgi:adenylate kinase